MSHFAPLRVHLRIVLVWPLQKSGRKLYLLLPSVPQPINQANVTSFQPDRTSQLSFLHRLWTKSPKVEHIPSMKIDNAVLSSNVTFVRWKVHHDWVTQVNIFCLYTSLFLKYRLCILIYLYIYILEKLTISLYIQAKYFPDLQAVVSSSGEETSSLVIGNFCIIFFIAIFNCGRCSALSG